MQLILRLLMPPKQEFIGSIISAGASLLGSKLASDSEDDANTAISANNAAQLGLARDQFDFQRRLANKGIRIRVKDAKAAGLHPLFALGANVPSINPVSYVPGQANSGSHMGSGIAAAGAALGGYFNKKAQAKAVAQQNLLDRQYHMLRMAQIQSDLKTDEVYRQMLGSQIKRLEVEANSTRGGLAGVATPVPDLVQIAGKALPDPTQVQELVPTKIRGPHDIMRSGQGGTSRKIYSEEAFQELAQLATAVDPYLEYIKSLWDGLRWRGRTIASDLKTRYRSPKKYKYDARPRRYHWRN